MYCYKEKPEKLKTEHVIDPEGDKKLGLYLSLGAVGLAAVLVGIGCIFVPIAKLYDVGGVGSFVLRAALIIVMAVVYYCVHELMHSLVLKRLTGDTAKIIFEKHHARCVSDTVFTLKGYIIYCFAPVVIIGTVLLILNIVLPDRFFWQVYIIQIINIAGAAGEFYAAYRLIKERKELAVLDDGEKLTYWT